VDKWQADWNGLVDSTSAERDSLRAEVERLRDGLRVAIRECNCTFKERLSGHLVDCYAPELAALLEEGK